MGFPWRGLYYNCPPTCGSEDLYYVPASAVGETGAGGAVEVPVSALSGFGQTTDHTAMGRWVVGLSLGVSLALFVGTLALRGTSR